MSGPTLSLHATAISLAGQGVLIRGRSGAGKSLLALALLDRWDDRGELVADDLVRLSVGNGVLLAHAPERLRGQIELRGRGPVARPSRSAVPIVLVVDLVPDLVRWPEPSAFTTDLCGVALRRAPVPTGLGTASPHQLLLVVEALRQGPAQPT